MRGREVDSARLRFTARSKKESMSSVRTPSHAFTEIAPVSRYAVLTLLRFVSFPSWRDGQDADSIVLSLLTQLHRTAGFVAVSRVLLFNSEWRIKFRGDSSRPSFAFATLRGRLVLLEKKWRRMGLRETHHMRFFSAAVSSGKRDEFSSLLFAHSRVCLS